MPDEGPLLVERRTSVALQAIDGLRTELSDDFTRLERDIERLQDRVNEIQTELRAELLKHEEQERTLIMECNARFIEHVDRSRRYEDVIDSILERERARADFWKSVSSSVVASGVWAVFVGMGAILWFWLEHNLKK